jgi:sulfide:quinone oxidoreductase
MSKFIQITPDFAVAGQLGPDDVARAAALGFRTIINNRPDGEERGQPTSEETQRTAAAFGLGYAHIPTTRSDVFSDEVVGHTAQALAGQSGPVLAHCKSGQRSAIVWAAAMARERPVAEVLASLNAAGLDLGFLRDELERQADRGEPTPARRLRRTPSEAVIAR